MANCVNFQHRPAWYRIRNLQVNDSKLGFPLGYSLMESRGTRIKSKRVARGYTQLSLAESLGVTKATVSKWEAAVSPEEDVAMDPEVFFMLCRVLIIEPERLLWGDSMQPPAKGARRPAAATKPPIKP